MQQNQLEAKEPEQQPIQPEIGGEIGKEQETGCWEWEAACAEEGSHNVLFCRRNSVYGRCEATQMHTHRERERHKELYLY